MADVIVVPQDSKLQLRFVVGTDPNSGAPILKTKTFSKVKSSAVDQDIYDVANTLVGLQKYPLDEIRLIKSSQLTE